MQDHGPWKIKRQHDIYQDPWIRVRRDEVVRPDGEPGTYSVVHLKPGVSVLAVDAQRQVQLTEEFHYGVGRVTIEVVSGGIEPNEDPQAAARRELQEELGIQARQWIDAGCCDPFTASVVSPTRLFIARELEFGAPDLEGTEQIRRICMPLDEAVQRVMRSQITHAPSCLLILKADRLL